MTLGDVRDLVESFGGWARFEVWRDGSEPAALAFYPAETRPSLVADALALRGVTFPNGRVVRWTSNGVLFGDLDGTTIKVLFRRPSPAPTTEEV